MFAKRGFAARLFLSARSKHPEAEGRVCKAELITPFG